MQCNAWREGEIGCSPGVEALVSANCRVKVLQLRQEKVCNLHKLHRKALLVQDVGKERKEGATATYQATRVAKPFAAVSEMRRVPIRQLAGLK